MFNNTHRYAAMILFVMLAVLSGCASATPSSPSEAVNLELHQGKIPLGPRVEILEDPTSDLTVEQILRGDHEGEFEQSREEVPDFGYADSTYWARVDLRHNESESKRWLLEIGYALLKNIDVYIVEFENKSGSRDDLDVSRWRGGSAVDVGQRPYRHHTHVFPISLQPRSEATLFVRVSSQGSVILPMDLWPMKDFAQSISTEFSLIGLYLGLLLGLLAYNLFIWSIVREAAYLLYCCFIASSIFFYLALSGTGELFLSPWFPNDASSLAAALSGVFGLIFSARFLGSRKNLGRYHYCLLFMIAWALLLVVLWGILPYRPVAQATSLGAIFWTFSAFVAGLIAFKRRIPAARYYLLAWTVFLIGTTFQAARIRGIVPSNLVTEHAQFVGSAAEAVLLSVALAARMRTLKEDKEVAQNEALHQKQRALDTEQRYSRELEDEVRARTSELEQSLDRVAALNDEALSAHARTDEYLNKVETLINNSGEGFLSFGPDRLVEDGYSAECRRLFNAGELAGCDVAWLLAGDDADTRELIEETLAAVFDPQTPASMVETYLSLLPAHYQLSGGYCEADFRYLADPDKVMLVLNDITERTALENQLAEERQQLHFTVYALTQREEFRSVVADFEHLLDEELGRLLNEAEPGQALSAIHRQLHTFKSLFAQASCSRLPGALHERESALAALGDSAGEPSRERIEACIDASGLRRELENELATLRHYLGEAYFEREASLQVPTTVIDQLEIRAREAAGADSELVRLVHSLRHEPLQKMLMPHIRMAHYLAGKLGKALNPVHCIGDNPRVDPDRWSGLIRTLVHGFRNAVDHGIESPEERVERGKDEEANLHCHIRADDERLWLNLEDDGRGLDARALRETAVSRGLISAEEAAGISDERAWQLVFEESISSCEQVTAVSGRGIGLAALKHEVVRLGGTITAESEPGRGTRFIIEVPLRTANRSKASEVADKLRR